MNDVFVWIFSLVFMIAFIIWVYKEDEITEDDKKKEEKSTPHRPLGGLWYFEVLFRKYAVFSGRARRKEYWQFVLVNMIIGFLLLWVDYEIGTNQYPIISWLFLFGFHGVYSLAVTVPSIAVTVRRLHDVGKSGWWLLVSNGALGFTFSSIYWYEDFGRFLIFGLVALISSIVLFIFLCFDSQKGENQYGLNPKAEYGTTFHMNSSSNNTDVTSPTQHNLNTKLSKVVENAIAYPEQFLKQIPSQEVITLEKFREYPEKMAKILIFGTLSDLLEVQLSQRANLDLNLMNMLNLSTVQIYEGICKGDKQQKASIDSVLDDLIKQAIQDPNHFLLLIESPEPMTWSEFHNHSSKDAKEMIFGVLLLKLVSAGYIEDNLLKDPVVTTKLFDTSSIIYNILRVNR